MKDLLQIARTEINAELEKEYKFFQISDMHLAYVDEKSSEVDRAEKIRWAKQWVPLKYELAEKFGEKCDERYDIDPCIIFEALCAHAVKFGADALILSGDIIDRIVDSPIRYLADFFSKYPLPVIYCPGNHASLSTDGVYSNMYDRLAPIIKNPAFDVFDMGEFEIVTVDNGLKQITDDQLSRLQKEIEGNKKILLVIHAPLKLGEFAEKMNDKLEDYFFCGADTDEKNAHEFVRLVKENDDRFIAVLAGHIHGATEYHITDSLMQYTASSGLIGYGREIIIR